jgi:hypothetical protein
MLKPSVLANLILTRGYWNFLWEKNFDPIFFFFRGIEGISCKRRRIADREGERESEILMVLSG